MRDVKRGLSRIKDRYAQKAAQAAASATVAVMASDIAMPAMALAAGKSANSANAEQQFKTLLDGLSKWVGIAGAFLVIWGLIQVGLAVRTDNGGGGQMHQGIFCMIAGVLVGIAAVAFGGISK